MLKSRSTAHATSSTAAVISSQSAQSHLICRSLLGRVLHAYRDSELVKDWSNDPGLDVRILDRSRALIQFEAGGLQGFRWIRWSARLMKCWQGQQSRTLQETSDRVDRHRVGQDKLAFHQTILFFIVHHASQMREETEHRYRVQMIYPCL